MGKLVNKRHEAFCKEYLVDLNATRAYRDVYSAAQKVSEVNGCKLLSNTKVSQRISELKKKVTKKVEITIDGQLSFLKNARDIDLTHWYTLGSRGMSMEQFDSMPKELRILVTGAKKKVNNEGHETIEVTFFSKEKAVELLGKYKEMWTDKKKIEGGLTVTTIEQLVEEDEE